MRAAINALIQSICDEAKVDPLRFMRLVFVCNPVMHHLLLGIDPVELGQAPFALGDVEFAVAGRARPGPGSRQPRRARLYPALHRGPCRGRCAAVALSEEPNKSKDMVLIVDVGTNAESCWATKRACWPVPRPPAPPLKARRSRSGQRAAPGAIERVEIDPVTKEPRFKVIGSDLWSTDPGFAAATATTGITGICGSGIIEAVAEMRMAGIVDAAAA